MKQQLAVEVTFPAVSWFVEVRRVSVALLTCALLSTKLLHGKVTSHPADDDDNVNVLELKQNIIEQLRFYRLTSSRNIHELMDASKQEKIPAADVNNRRRGVEQSHHGDRRSYEFNTPFNEIEYFTTVDKRRSAWSVLPPDNQIVTELPVSTCPSSASWQALRLALDVNNTLVRVYQPEVNLPTTAVNPDSYAGDTTPGDQGPTLYTGLTVNPGRIGTDHENGQGQGRLPLPVRQWFYTVTCRNDAMAPVRDCPGCCIGIDHARFRSSCQQKRSYVMAYVSRISNQLSGASPGGTRQYEWSWIQVNSSCCCAVVSRPLARPNF